jgi:hypothetical protein
MRGFARMRDGNERENVAALKAAGASVTQLNGTGVPDLLVGFRDRTFLLEVKLPEDRKPGGASQRYRGGDGTLTPAQQKWWKEWAGEPARVVRSADDALTAIGVCLRCKQPHAGNCN